MDFKNKAFPLKNNFLKDRNHFISGCQQNVLSLSISCLSLVLEIRARGFNQLTGCGLFNLGFPFEKIMQLRWNITF